MKRGKIDTELDIILYSSELKRKRRDERICAEYRRIREVYAQKSNYQICRALAERHQMTPSNMRLLLTDRLGDEYTKHNKKNKHNNTK
jgi:hypothetical protein